MSSDGDACPNLSQVLDLSEIAELLLHYSGPLAARKVTVGCKHLKSILIELLPAIERLVEKRLFVFGGHGGRGQGPHTLFRHGLCFDPSCSNWNSIVGPAMPRSGSAAVAVDGFICIMGGLSQDEEPTSSVERLDLSRALGKDCSWEVLPSLQEARAQCSAAAIRGTIFVAGGFGEEALFSVESFCGLTDSLSSNFNWEPAQAMMMPRGHASACALNGDFYLLGGKDAGYRTLSVADKLQRAADDCLSAWVSLPPMKFARAGCAAAAANGCVFVVGGVTTWTPLVEVEYFNPLVGTWEQLEPMSDMRRDCAAVRCSGRVYIFGGSSHAGKCTSRTEWFSVETNSWKQFASLPEARCSFVAAAAWC
eukprot:TRINITY_DN6617_c2_g1_i1.p1 TRINITY_DN6617_c2_g1~~TRINITY_DN6617_c2_g1_i1.p1  ORF type:complete len:373 (-),score=54.75 TRINITY_DN6617_c2_g1_i1:106-1200(-)